MKILFITEGNFPDYQSDMILHGLRTSNHDVIDYPHAWYMYKDLKENLWNIKIPFNGNAYGMGFTINGTLDNIDIDRDNIEDKIKSKYFDIVIYGSCRRNLIFLDIVEKIYKKDEIYFIDGEDHNHIDYELVNKGKYFKRELITFDTNIYPINFCYPKEKIYNGEEKKILKFAKIKPNNKSTYIYKNEEDYYKGYQIAQFGITMKKAGWDCLRHYEIIGNKCLPYFTDIKQCPKRTLAFFPKEICYEINKDIENKILYDQKYFDYLKEITEHFEKYLTTDKMSNYLLNI